MQTCNRSSFCNVYSLPSYRTIGTAIAASAGFAGSFCSHLFNLMIQNLNRSPRILFRDAALGIDPDKIRSLFG